MAHEVHILGRLLPVGSFEINSDKLYGDFVLLKDKGTINSRKLSVRTTSLETGIQLRDEHLHKYLNASKHPRIFIKDVIIKNFKGSKIDKLLNWTQVSDTRSFYP